MRPLVPAVLALVLGTAPLCAAEAPVLPVLTVIPGDGGLAITASVTGPADRTVAGKLTVQRRDGGNALSSSQGREVTLSGAEPSPIATIEVDFGEGASLEAVLEVTLRGKTVARSALTLGPGMNN